MVMKSRGERNLARVFWCGLGSSGARGYRNHSLIATRNRIVDVDLGVGAFADLRMTPDAEIISNRGSVESCFRDNRYLPP